MKEKKAPTLQYGSSSVAVIAPRFCVPQRLISHSQQNPLVQTTKGELAGIDAGSNIVFRTKHSWNYDLNHLQDAGGHTPLTIKKKPGIMHEGWEEFAGDITEAKDLVFSVRSSNLPSENVWLVHLAANAKEEEECDYKIIGSYQKVYTIYRGDFSSDVAQFTRHGFCSVSGLHFSSSLPFFLLQRPVRSTCPCYFHCIEIAPLAYGLPWCCNGSSADCPCGIEDTEYDRTGREGAERGYGHGKKERRRPHGGGSEGKESICNSHVTNRTAQIYCDKSNG